MKSDLPPELESLAERVNYQGLVSVRTQLALGTLQAMRRYSDGRIEQVAAEAWNERHGEAIKHLLGDLRILNGLDEPSFSRAVFVVFSDKATFLPSRKAGGRPSKHDWEGAMIELAKIAVFEDGDVSRKKMNERLLAWFVKHTDDHPSDSQIRNKVERFHSTLWPPKT